MNELQDLILSSHQLFFALVACAFTFFLMSDLSRGDKLIELKERRGMVFFLLAFAGGVFTLLYESWGEQGLFLALEFSILVTCSLIHPKYAISFLLYLLLSRPWETYDNQMMGSMPRDVSYLTLISVVAHKVFRKQYYFRFNGGTFLLVAFSAWIFISAFVSPHADEAMLQYSEIFSKGIILFLLIQNGIEKSSDILPIKAVFVLAILEKCFVSYYKSHYLELASIIENENSRLESTGILSNSNDIAAIFVLAVPFTIFLLLKTKLKPFNWIASVIALIGMTFLVWQSQSRGALLGMFAIFGAYSLIKIQSNKLRLIAIGLGIVGLVGAFSLMQRDAEDIEGSTSNRKIYWQAGINMAVNNPVFGVGFWGFPKNLPKYVPNGDVGSEKEHMTAHSSWILPLGEGGFMALLLFLGLWIYAAFAAWKIRLDQPEYLLGVAGYGMTISFLSHTYLLYPYILLALVITHYHIEKKQILIKA